MTDTNTTDYAGSSLYRIGSAAALLCALMYLIALAVYIPAYRAGPPPTTVLEWLTLFQVNPLTGLFFLGLADIAIMILWGPMTLALYAALQPSNKTWTLLATLFVFVGMAVYLATNTAFSMLALSQQYAAATTEAQRSNLLSAGQAMLAVTEGARMLPLTPLAGLILSTVMLRSKAFGQVTAWAGILGLGLLAASGLFAGYATTGPTTLVLSAIIAVTYGGGGLLSFLWYILIGRTLWKLANRESQTLLPAAIAQTFKAMPH